MDADISFCRLSYLSHEAKYLLTCLLNPSKVFLSDCDLPRDWRGLASLIKISTEVAASINTHYDKTAKVLDIWIQKDDGTATVGKLMEYLQLMDRYDVYDDLQEIASRGQLTTFVEHRVSEMKQISIISQRESKIIEWITYDDKRCRAPQQYHAYVLFAREDQKFVDELLLKMRAKGYKLCTEDDLLPGHTTQYVPVSKLLMDRCHRIIVIYSEHFFKRPANRFFIDYAQAVSIEFKGNKSGQPKLIPCVYRKCALPDNVTFYHNLHYTPEDERPIYNFWSRLDLALEATDLDRQNEYSPDSTYSSMSIREMSHSSIQAYVKKKLFSQKDSNKAYTEFYPSKDLLSIESMKKKKVQSELFAIPGPKKAVSMNHLNISTNGVQGGTGASSVSANGVQGGKSTLSVNGNTGNSKSMSTTIRKMFKGWKPKKKKEKVLCA